MKMETIKKRLAKERPMIAVARSPSCSCASLRFLWPTYWRTSTSKIAPMLGAQSQKPAPVWEAGFGVATPSVG